MRKQLRFSPSLSYIRNQAMKKQIHEICTISSFRTTPSPTVGGGHAPVLGSPVGTPWTKRAFKSTREHSTRQVESF